MFSRLTQVGLLRRTIQSPGLAGKIISWRRSFSLNAGPRAPSRHQAHRSTLERFRWLAVLLALAAWGSERAAAQSACFAGNSQHTGLYSAAAQPLNRILWSTSIDLYNTGAYAHYGAPLITLSNTVLVPIKTRTNFLVSAFDGATGRLKYTLTSNYQLPSHDWIPAYQPGLATLPTGLRLYYADAGGGMNYIDNPDSDTPGAPGWNCFYTDPTTYSNNAAAFNSSVFVNTPITADTNGVVYFGFRIETNGAPAPLSTTNSGFVRLDPAGNATYVLAGPAASDPAITRDSHNSAPALSNDGTTLYVVVKSAASSSYAYLLGLDTTTLATKYRVRLPTIHGEGPSVLDDGTASPMVAPDGDVFFGVVATGSRGFLLHFSADLQTQKTPSGFGWDHTPEIVPASMVPGYIGTSSYLLFSKYNDYAGTGSDGTGINRVALLDPNATQLDPHTSAQGLREMRVVMSVIGCTPDPSYMGATYPYAVHEWCIDAAVVNPATASVFAPSEDGRIYRWNLASNSLTETLTLSRGFGAPYVPVTVGPDGTVYALNGGLLFALGGLTNVAVGVSSSAPDLTSVVATQALTFTAAVSNLDGLGPQPTGSVAFQDVTYHGLTVVTNILATGVSLSNGVAVLTDVLLTANTNYLGSHFITASYSGDSNFPPGTATLVQKVHASGTTTTVGCFATGTNAVTLVATVAPALPATGTPTGMVSFWDGTNSLMQVPLTNGVARLTVTNLSGPVHVISANYGSDTLFASSTGTFTATPPYLTGLTVLPNGAFQFVFSNAFGGPFSVFGSTDLTPPATNWSLLGPAMETGPGQFQFTDPQATNGPTHYYRVRSP